jgi:hypothetical protein
VRASYKKKDGNNNNKKIDATRKQVEKNEKKNEPLEVHKPCKKFEIKGHGEPNLGLLFNFNFPNLGEKVRHQSVPTKVLFIYLFIVDFHPYGSGFIQHFSFIPFSFFCFPSKWSIFIHNLGVCIFFIQHRLKGDFYAELGSFRQGLCTHKCVYFVKK